MVAKKIKYKRILLKFKGKKKLRKEKRKRIRK
jgi:hypothetical protein